MDRPDANEEFGQQTARLHEKHREAKAKADDIVTYGQGVIEERARRPNKQALEDVKRNLAALSESARRESRVFFDQAGAWLNKAMVRHALNIQVGNQRTVSGLVLDNAPVRWNRFTQDIMGGQATVAHLCVHGRDLAQLAATGCFGESRRTALLVSRVNSREDFFTPVPGFVRHADDQLVEPWGGRVRGDLLDRRFQQARGELARLVNAVKPGRVPLMSLPHVWAAADGKDPWAGLADSLESVLPLELGYSARLAITVWIRQVREAAPAEAAEPQQVAPEVAPAEAAESQPAAPEAAPEEEDA